MESGEKTDFQSVMSAAVEEDLGTMDRDGSSLQPGFSTVGSHVSLHCCVKKRASDINVASGQKYAIR